MRFTEPFPHVVIDDYLDAATVRAINSEWPEDWQKEAGRNTIKWATQALPETAARVVAGVDMAMVEKAVKINGLFGDPELFGGGLHCIPRGGFLNMHVDFNQHPKGWHRRVNMLIYLNERWDDSWNGHLQLGLDYPKLVAPIGGRCVIFETNARSWHGHPAPLMCPEDVQRRSLALYFYTPERAPDAPRTTVYVR